MVAITVDSSIFTFPDDWEVEAYDTWRLASRLAGGSLQAKACDIVAVAGDTLYLVEVKDYTYPNGTRPPKLSALAATVATKGFHTLAGLCVGAHLDFDKSEFCGRAIRCSRVELYLSVELPADKGHLFTQSTVLAGIRDLLSHEVKPYLSVKPLVVSSRTGGAPWSSAWDPQRRSRAAT